MSIGDIVRVHRVQHNMTQSDLACKICRDFTYISRLETGKEDPKANEVMLMSEIFQSRTLKVIAFGIQVEPVMKIS